VTVTAKRRALVIDPADNVANALEDVAAGEIIAAKSGSSTIELPAVERIPFGFKVALADVRVGGEVCKYGEVIGRASRAIPRGALVHIHNLEGARGRGDLARSVAGPETETETASETEAKS
jgi:altronate dehydratase small subunit